MTTTPRSDPPVAWALAPARFRPAIIPGMPPLPHERWQFSDIRPRKVRTRSATCYHLRITKKWLKRFGVRHVPRPLSGFYLPFEGRPVLVDLQTWVAFEARHPNTRFIARDEVGGRVVSTVFLFIDHAFGDSGPPVTYETMVFEDGHGGDMRRYSTEAEARAGHAEFIRQLTTTAGTADQPMQEHPREEEGPIGES